MESEGQGLGNKFLAHIRECDAIAQVLRAFDDENVIHVDGGIDPMRDAETIGLELALADLETISKRHDAVSKQLKAGKTPELEIQVAAYGKARELLEAGKPLRDAEWTEEERKQLKLLSMLTLKPMLYVVNADEGQMGDGSWKAKVAGLEKPGVRVVPVCVKMEAELAGLSDEEKKEYLVSMGQETSGLDRLIVEAYAVLGLITFFTSGPQETRAWTVVKGAKAPQAAGVIHTDFEKGFIRAEVLPVRDFVEQGGEARCREKGLVRIEGKEYVVRDGDTCYFRVNS
jgi:GTP-binding protein YchF